MASTRPVSAMTCRMTYVAAVVFICCAFAFPVFRDPYWDGLLAHCGATFVVFLFSFATSNSSLYDPAWVIFPVVLVLGWMASAGSAPSFRGVYSLALLFAWCVRYNWAFPWEGWVHGIASEDWRYAEVARRTGSGTALYWLLSLISLHLTPTLLVWFGLAAALPAWADGAAGPALGLWDLSAVIIATIAILVMAIADEQLRRFREAQYGRGANLGRATSSKAICREGLWRFSRHPNYFGEALFWLGVALVGAAAGGRGPATWGGSAGLFAFFRCSALMTDQRMLKHRGDRYRAVMAEVSALVPLPPCLKNPLM